MSLEQISKRIKEVASRLVSVRTGTVVSDNAAPASTLVRLDGDPSGSPVVGHGLNFPLPVGSRVSCLAHPPRGLLILGVLGALPDPYPAEDSGWIVVGSGGSAPAFENSWANFGGGYGGARFRKVGDRVYLDGMIAGGSVGTVFTLPVGYRPSAQLADIGLVQQSQTGAASAGTAHTHQINHSATFMLVTTAGAVGSLSGHVTSTYQSLAGISFFVN